jgi:hypothetical protein
MSETKIVSMDYYGIDGEHGTMVKFVIVFGDGEYEIVNDFTYSRAKIQAAHLRYQAGAETGRQLGVINELSLKLTRDYRRGVNPNDFQF